MRYISILNCYLLHVYGKLRMLIEINSNIKYLYNIGSHHGGIAHPEEKFRSARGEYKVSR